jgi:osmoprotectant transport system permease protein
VTPPIATAAAAAAPVIPNFGGNPNSCVRRNGAFCWDWVSSHWGSTLRPELFNHIELTVIAVGIGLPIALTAALLAYRFHWLETPFIGVWAFLYTIPSIALFQLLVPVTGITRTTAEVALVSYTLLILFRNTVTGLRDVPEEVREAALGMGFTPRQTFLRVELPLALPAIFAGLRVATVTVISLATIAAYIIDQGLGKPIFDAIGTGFKTELVAASVLAMALALGADALIVLVQRVVTPWTARRRTA